MVERERPTLARYRERRAFERTPEPAGRAHVRRGPLGFVVQLHRARREHYDFRLELDGVLRSWALPNGLPAAVGDKRLAAPTEDHPLEYAGFEGVIPKGEYGAGPVIVWDCGAYAPVSLGAEGWADRDAAADETRAALEKGAFKFELRGVRSKGQFSLVRTKDGWLVIRRTAAPEAAPPVPDGASALTGRTLSDLRGADRPAAELPFPQGALERLPPDLAPMLAEASPLPVTRAGWRYEPKVDGYRALAFVEDGRVRLRSRNGRDYAATFPQICTALAAQGANLVLDGEIVALDPQGRPSFGVLQERAQAHGEASVAAEAVAATLYVAFDLLHFAGMNLRPLPWRLRRRALEQLLVPAPRVQRVATDEDAEALYRACVERGLEGIVGKRMDAPYLPGRRSSAWVKVKPVASAEFVVGGWTAGVGDREPLGSLLLGEWQDGELRYVGGVGSGLERAGIAALRARLAPLATRTRPFAQRPALRRSARWVRPELVVEVRFQERTRTGHLRAPVFVRLRDDVPVAGDDGATLGAATRATDATGEAAKTGATGKTRKTGAKGRSNTTATTGTRRAPRTTRTSRTAGPSTTASARSRSATASAADAPVIGAVLAQLDAAGDSATLDVGGHALPVTNLGREYWPATGRAPAITKRDLLRFLARISPLMLPHLRDRPFTMVRLPGGLGGERFFQKHWDRGAPSFVRKVAIWSDHRDEATEYVLCNDLPTLLWLGQVGTLEFHVWHSRTAPGSDAASDSTDFASSRESLEASVLNYPDYLVFDLDPYLYSGQEAAGAEPEYHARGFAKTREIAFRVREALGAMGFTPYVKTSGKTGLHVFVPIERTLRFELARDLVEQVGRHLVRLVPEDVTMEWAVKRRTGKVFFDHNMNVRGKTLNVAYSPRAIPGATVSWPLTWEALAHAVPEDFRIDRVAALPLPEDAWARALTDKQSVERTLGTTRED